MGKTVLRTIKQYNSEAIDSKTMERLCAVADRYHYLKDYVYQRYGGVKSYRKLTPGYEIYHELQRLGVRKETGLPTVYFQRALYEALGDIRGQWGKAKSSVRRNVKRNINLEAEDRHYLFFVLNSDDVFDAVINRKILSEKSRMYESYNQLKCEVESRHLDNYMRRQIRKHYHKPHVVNRLYFTSDSRGYSYKEGSIGLASMERGKRIEIPLTDSNIYDRQLRIMLYPEKNAIEILHPVDIHSKKVSLSGSVGLSIGYYVMLTTDKGNRYGTDIAEIQREYTRWINKALHNRAREKAHCDIGSKKYISRKNVYKQRLNSYINEQLNLFFEKEAPEAIYLPKYPPAKGSQQLAGWQRGYIEKRLTEKAQLYGTKLVRVYGKRISEGGYTPDEQQNAAINALQRGLNQ